jgi:transcriptional regulator with XRE-family HTH domain
MNADQSRMARAALKLGIRDVAKIAKVAPSTVSRLEAGESLNPRTVEAIQRAFEAAGVEFTNSDAPGVRLKARPGGSSGRR